MTFIPVAREAGAEKVPFPNVWEVFGKPKLLINTLMLLRLIRNFAKQVRLAITRAHTDFQSLLYGGCAT